MPGQRPLREADIIYRYDGSLAGFFCCVFESFARRELPFAIWDPEAEQPSLCPVRDIPTDPERAARVRRGIRTKLGPAAGETVAVAFLSGQEDKELVLLRFLHDAFSVGPGALRQLGRPKWPPSRAWNETSSGRRKNSAALSGLRRAAGCWAR